MRNRTKIYQLPFILLSAALLTSGCGGQSVKTQLDSESNNLSGSNNINNNNNSSNNNNNNNNDNNTNDTEDDTSTSTGDYSIAGVRSLQGDQTSANKTKTPSIYTDSLLSVTLTANSQGSVADSGYSITSACISFDVAVYNSETNKQIGSTKRVYVSTGVNGTTGCSGSSDGQAHPTANFSSALTSGSRNSVYIVISNAYSDTCGPLMGYGKQMQCVSYYYNYCQAYMPTSCYKQLYYSWTVTGTYSIKTNSVQ